MNENSRKKQIERRQLGLFRNIFPDFPKGEIVSAEKPDFLVKGETQNFGIEITELHREPSNNGITLQAQDELLKRICTKAEQIHVEKGILPVHVVLHFDDSFLLKKRHIAELSNWIAEYIEDHIPVMGEIVQEEKFIQSSCDFPEAIWRIQIIGLSEEEKSVFWSPHAISVLDITPEQIQRTLDKKKALYQSYRAQAEEVWLLIPYETGKPSTVFNSHEPSKDCKYESPFQKVFLMNCFMRSFSEISIKQPREA